MPDRSGAGALDKRVIFMEPVDTEDGHGGTVLEWADKSPVWARLQPKIGGEEVVNSRLQGVQPYIMRVRSSSLTRQVTPEWRARNQHTGACYAIKSGANLDERNAYIDFLVVDGDDD